MVFLVGLLLGSLAACRSSEEARSAPSDAVTPPGATAPASVLLITIDTLRADRLSADGPMPRLWALAQRGLRFTTVHTPTPLTLPAHASLLSGLGPARHGVRDNIGYVLPSNVPTIAESFAASGVSTAAFVGGYPLDRAFGLARGFEVYDDKMTRAPADGRKGHTERRAEEVLASAVDWLTRIGDRRFFAWVHLFDPHDPYEAPSPFAGLRARAYDDEVAYTDDVLGRLVDAVLARGAEPPWIVVTADHGEALGDHGEATHGIFLYESTLRVPLVIVPPVATVARALDFPVTLLDLAPTILASAGLPALPAAQGRSLLPWMQEAPRPEPRPLYVESVHARQRYGWAPLAGFVDWPEKFVAAPKPELYDLERDPGELDNRFTRERADALEQRLRELHDASDGAELAADPDTQIDLERLRSLGYVGGSGVARPPDALYDRPRPDPKDRIAAIPQIDRGVTALIAGKDAEARRAFEAALLLDPDNMVALNDLGLIALRAGDLSRAEGFFREALGRDEQAETTANNLGLALGGLERYADAEDAFRRALAVRPSFTIARFNLAIMLQRQGKRREALEQLERVQGEQADFPGLQATMAELRQALAAGR